MARVLRRLGREGGLASQLEAARGENKGLLCKYTALQVGVLCCAVLAYCARAWGRAVG